MINRNRRNAKASLSKLLPATAITAMGLGWAAIPAGTAAASPAPAGTKTPTATTKISEAGSTLLEPLFGLWASAYHKHDPHVTITPSGGGSGTGISDAATSIVNIGASDAYLSGSDRAQYSGLKNIALAISAQMINYNVKGLSSKVHLKLNGSLLAEMYQGKVTNWDDAAIQKLNPGVKLPNETIAPLHRTDSSGDTFLFTSFLNASDHSGWGKIGYGTTVSFPAVSTAVGEIGNGGMVSGCKATPGCVAYIGISYRSDTNSAKLGEAMLANKSGKYELPNAASISAEAASYTKRTPANESVSMIYGSATNGYPIINYEYAIVPAKEPAPAAAAVKAFLDWAISPSGGNSPRYLDKVNFQPLPHSVASISHRLIASTQG